MNMVGSLPGADALKEAAKQKVEEQVGGQSPGYLKPFFPCLGGPVGAMEKCMCVVPADKQEELLKAIQKYKDL